MKNLFLILLSVLGFQLSAFAQATNLITTKITITTATSNNFALTLNGDTRVFTNSVTASASQIITNHTVAGSASNLYNHLVSSPFSRVQVTGYTNGSNVLYLRGQLGVAMSATILSNWATVSYSTQVFSSGLIAVRVPIATEAASVQTNVASLLVKGISDSAQNSFPTGATALLNYIDTSGRPQTLSGDTITNSLFKRGTNDAVAGTNAPFSGGSNLHYVVFFLRDGTASNVNLKAVSAMYGSLSASSFITNGAFLGAALTNAVGSLIAPLIYTTGDEDVGDVMTITNSGSDPGIVFHNSDDEFGGGGMVFKFAGTTYWSIICNTNEFAIGNDLGGTLIGVNGTNVLIGAVGSLIQLGAEAHGSSLYGTLARLGTLHPTNLIGSNLVRRFVSSAGTYTSLVDGNNAALPTGTNLVLELSGGTTIAQIAGFAATVDGDEFEARFTGAITNWIVNEANSAFSTDATSGNRIKTGTGGDITQTNQPAWARFRYRGSGGTGRWELKSFSR